VSDDRFPHDDPHLRHALRGLYLALHRQTTTSVIEAIGSYQPDDQPDDQPRLVLRIPESAFTVPTVKTITDWMESRSILRLDVSFVSAKWSFRTVLHSGSESPTAAELPSQPGGE
jgi:hypothetical protein